MELHVYPEVNLQMPFSQTKGVMIQWFNRLLNSAMFLEPKTISMFSVKCPLMSNLIISNSWTRSAWEFISVCRKNKTRNLMVGTAHSRHWIKVIAFLKFSYIYVTDKTQQKIPKSSFCHNSIEESTYCCHCLQRIIVSFQDKMSRHSDLYSCCVWCPVTMQTWYRSCPSDTTTAHCTPLCTHRCIAIVWENPKMNI